MLCISKRPFRIYFVVAVTVDTYEQYVIFIRKLL